MQHAEHAKVRKCTLDHNNGIPIFFTKISDTCICGHLIAALCLLRLKLALFACVDTPDFLRAKNHCSVVIALTQGWYGNSSTPFAKLFNTTCALLGYC